MRFRWIGTLVFFLIIFSNNLYAIDVDAAVSNITSFTDPGRISRALQSNALPIEKTAPSTQRQQKPAPAFPGAEKIKFKLERVIINGNTVFSTQDLISIFAPSYNKTISLADLQGLVEKISIKYRDAGYILSHAILPAQEIKNGIVHVQVIEGFISKIVIEGCPGSARCVLQGYGNCILQSKPLNIHVLEREILLANDLPGLTVKSIITPSKKIPAGADLTLVVERKVLSGYASYDNYSTRFLGPQELTLDGSVNSFWFPGDSNSFRFVKTTRSDEMRFGEFIHTQPIGCSGLNLVLGGNYTSTQPGFTVQPLEIVGWNESIYGSLFYPVIRSRNENLIIRATANYQNVYSTLLSFPFYDDRFRVLTLGAFYNTTDKLEGYDTIDISANQGFDIFGAGQHLLMSRPDGQSKFTTANLTASRDQPFCKRFSFYVSVQGQYAFDPLLATEQYGFGGPIYGRGYGPSEIVGDRGAAGKVELRMDTSPELHYLQTIQYYTFYDLGAIWNIDTTAQPGKQSAASAGVGARFNFMKNLVGEFYIAQPLTRKALTLTPPGQNGYQARGFFQITALL